MPDRFGKAMFLLGLSLFIAGQVVLNTLGAASQYQSPIDFAHWLLLIGAVPLILSLPKTLSMRGKGNRSMMLRDVAAQLPAKLQLDRLTVLSYHVPLPVPC